MDAEAMEIFVPGTKEHNNPLEWWKLNQSKFPNVAELAKMYLSIQATSAATERIFSSLASRVISKLRSRMHPEMAGNLLFIASNHDDLANQVDEENDHDFQ
jgi:hypothetical protein